MYIKIEIVYYQNWKCLILNLNMYDTKIENVQH